MGKTYSSAFIGMQVLVGCGAVGVSVVFGKVARAGSRFPEDTPLSQSQHDSIQTLDLGLVVEGWKSGLGMCIHCTEKHENLHVPGIVLQDAKVGIDHTSLAWSLRLRKQELRLKVWTPGL